MSTVAEIQAAVKTLSEQERVELFRWLQATDTFRAEQERALLADLDEGIAEADRGELLEADEVIASLKARARGAA